MEYKRRLGQNLRRLRVERGLTQEALAAEAGIDRAHLGLIEAARENPSLDMIGRIAAALGVDVQVLFAPVAPDAAPAPGMRPGRKPGKR